MGRVLDLLAQSTTRGVGVSKQSRLLCRLRVSKRTCARGTLVWQSWSSACCRRLGRAAGAGHALLPEMGRCQPCHHAPELFKGPSYKHPLRMPQLGQGSAYHRQLLPCTLPLPLLLLFLESVQGCIAICADPLWRVVQI